MRFSFLGGFFTALFTFSILALLSLNSSALAVGEDYYDSSDYICMNNSKTSLKKDYEYKKVTRQLSGKPAIINIFTIDPKKTKAIIKPSYGSYFLSNVNSVKQITEFENALAGVNASFFKPDNGVPLGVSIIDGDIVTGPLYNRVVLGITDDNDFKMAKMGISGIIKIGKKIKLSLFNINQPIFSNTDFSIFTDQWGEKTPKTSKYYSHIVVEDKRVSYVKNSSVPIPKGGFVIVGPHKHLPKIIQKNDKVKYKIKLNPKDWDDVEFAVGGGPYLVKDGKVFIDKQKFSKQFLWTKAPRTAVGYTKGGILILVTVDGRQKGVSEGATLSELAKIMWELGAYNAMNLDGGSSTQMVVNGELVNLPTVKGGGRVTNALVIILPGMRKKS